MFSRRTEWERAANPIAILLEQLKAEGRAVLDLTESNPTRAGFLYPEKEILAALAQPAALQYAPSPQGLLSAREAVCAEYAARGYSVRPDQVFLTASTSEGYSFLFRLLADPGDTILGPRPSYPLFQFLTDLNDLKLEFYPLRYADRWRVDAAALDAALTPKVRAVMAVNPNNPTGSFLREDDRAALRGACRKNHCALIADEVFLDYPFGDSPAGTSLAAEKDQLTFVLGGLSKSLGLPQMKLSWIVVTGPEDLVAEASGRLEIIADTYLSVNTPVQQAWPQWRKLLPEIQAQIKARVTANRRVLAELLPRVAGSGILNADAGWYAVLRLPEVFSEDDVVLTLLKDEQVYVHPGFFFDFEDSPYIVVSLLPPPGIFREGVQRIVRRLA